jgi:dTDP-4-dehydrorhamnose reductase
MKQAEFHNYPLEIWGGVECSVVRINGTVHDQLKMNGHEERDNDLDLFADLGLTKLRYPLLWEKYVSQGELFFELHDKRLERLKSLNIDPIAGLLHHGSGPFDTDMMQSDFAERLAEYAYTIAKKYPWIQYYTPVNEPLTTARFSGLYGIWYPHNRDDYSFARIFLNELKGVILSMQRIREVNPDAKLIQTEDIARVHSTGKLKYQADLENERTWLTYDILSGKFNPDHLFYKYFLSIGIPLSDLEFFISNHCIPAICGFNYYVTSERFLDDRLPEYPNSCIGGNDFHDYADIEVVRVSEQKLSGIEVLLKEAATRYKLPVALTEIHLDCTREEQIRWFDEAYRAAAKLKSEGYDIRAITAWSLLGSFDWNTLLQLKGSYYESGVFDIRSGTPRPTALAGLIKTYATGNCKNNSLLEIPGWWKRNVRIKYHVPDYLDDEIYSELQSYNHIQPLLIFGDGSMTHAFERLCNIRGIPSVRIPIKKFHAYSESAILKIIEENNPWAIVNTSGNLKIDEAELSPLYSYQEYTLFPKVLASLCRQRELPMLTFSTDQVFNGKKRQPYLEADETDPLNVYGMSKKLAEDNILSINPGALIVRSGLLMNPWNNEDFLLNVLFNNGNKQGRYVYSDIVMSPAYITDVINTALDLLIDGEKGIWHISGPEAVSYYHFAKRATDIAGIDDAIIYSIPSIRLASHALIPSYTVLQNAGGVILPSLDLSISNYLIEARRRFSA